MHGQVPGAIQSHRPSRAWYCCIHSLPVCTTTIIASELPPTGSGDYSLTKLARSFTRSGQDTPSSRRSMGRAQQLAGWASYLLLPEVLGRELRCV